MIKREDYTGIVDHTTEMFICSLRKDTECLELHLIPSSYEDGNDAMSWLCKYYYGWTASVEWINYHDNKSSVVCQGMTLPLNWENHNS